MSRPTHGTGADLHPFFGEGFGLRLAGKERFGQYPLLMPGRDIDIEVDLVASEVDAHIMGFGNGVRTNSSLVIGDRGLVFGFEDRDGDLVVIVARQSVETVPSAEITALGNEHLGTYLIDKIAQLFDHSRRLLQSERLVVG